MRNFATLFVLMAFAVSALAQIERNVDFEGGQADTAWIVFANGAEGSQADIDVIANPAVNDVNSSDSVLSFYLQEDAVTWLGIYTDYDVLTEFTEEYHTLAMMVWKEMATHTGLKVERSITGGEDVRIKTPNTFTGEWELLLYDFTPAIGHYYERLTVFPDTPEEGDPPRDYLPTTVYLDNIGIPKEDNTSVKEHKGTEMMLYPTPAEYRMGVVYPEMIAITLSDIMGRQIRTLHFPATNSKVIETGDLTTGIYFVTADIRNGEKITMKFMKK